MTPLHTTPDQKLKNYFDFQSTVYKPLEQTSTAQRIFNLENTTISPLLGRSYTPKEKEDPVATVAEEVASTEENPENTNTFVDIANRYSNIDNRGNVITKSTYMTPTSPSDGSLFEMSKKGIGGAESSNNYSAHRWDTGKGGAKGSGAWGRYQFIAKWHKDDIKKVTGKTMGQFLKSPEDQDKYYEWYFTNKLLPQLQKIRNEGLGQNLSDLEIIGGLHFAGSEGMLKALRENTLAAEMDNNPTIKKHISKVLKYALA